MSGIGEAQQNMRNFGLAAQAPAQPDLSQYQARGMEALAAGFENLGATMFRIEERKAEAKNYVDVTEADTAMMKLRGDFDKWKLQNPNPAGWEAKWNSLSTDFANTYLSDKEISPKAREQITAKMSAFTTREAISVGVDSVKGQVQMAKSANMANIDYAIDQGNIAEAKKHADMGVQMGLYHQFEADHMIRQGEDKVADQKRDELDLKIKTFRIEGDLRLSIPLVQAAVAEGTLTELEGKAQILALNKEIVDVENFNKTYNEVILNPREALESVESGEINLTPKDRSYFTEMANTLIAKEDAATVKGILERYRNSDDAREDSAFGTLPPELQRQIVTTLDEGYKQSITTFYDLKTRVETIDIGDPAAQTKFAQATLDANFLPDAQRDEIMQIIRDRQENPNPVEMSAGVKQRAFKILEDRASNGAIKRFKYEYDEIEQGVELDEEGNETGRSQLFVLDENAPEEFRFGEQRKWLFDWKRKGFMPVGDDYEGKTFRKIELSAEQVLLFKGENKKTVYEDVIASEEIDRELGKLYNALEVKIDEGETRSFPEAIEWIDTVTGRNKKKQIQAVIEKSADQSQMIDDELERAVARASEPLIRAIPIKSTEDSEQNEDGKTFYGPDGEMETQEDTVLRIDGTNGTMIIPGYNESVEVENSLFPIGKRPKN